MGLLQFLIMNILTKYANILMETLKENKKLIAICFAVYIIMVIASYILSYNVISANSAAFNSYIAPYSNSTLAKRGALDLFLNNSGTVLFSYFGGIIFGIIPVFSLLFNSYALGAQIASFGFIEAGGSLKYIVYLIPHGIFEIPASILGSVSGLMMFRFVWRLMKDLLHGKGSGFGEKLSNAFQNNMDVLIQSFVLAIFCIILMAIAAPLENYVSSAFSRFLLNY